MVNKILKGLEIDKDDLDLQLYLIIDSFKEESFAARKAFLKSYETNEDSVSNFFNEARKALYSQIPTHSSIIKLSADDLLFMKNPSLYARRLKGKEKYNKRCKNRQLLYEKRKALGRI